MSKKVELIDAPIGVWTRAYSRNHLLDGAIIMGGDAAWCYHYCSHLFAIFLAIQVCICEVFFDVCASVTLYDVHTLKSHCGFMLLINDLSNMSVLFT